MIVLIVLLLFATIPLAIKGLYTTAFEGAKAEFTGWELYNQWYPLTGWCNIQADSTPLDVYYDFEGTSFTVSPQDANNQIWTKLCGGMGAISFAEGQEQKPVKEYRWQFDNDNGTVSVFRMELWKMRWGVNMWTVTHDWYKNLGYQNVKIWERINLEPIWYFEDQPNQVYFGVAAIECYNITFVSGTQAGLPQVFPASYGELLTIDVPSGTVPPEQAFYSYQGQRLNPDLFRPYVNTHISLDQFGPVIQRNILGIIYGGEDCSVRWLFNVYIFVVGEWVVLPETAGDIGTHEARSNLWSFLGLGGLLDWLTNPFVQFWLWLTIVAIIIIIILASTGAIPGIIMALRTKPQATRKGR